MRRLLQRKQLFPWNLEVHIALVDRRTMQGINRQFRGKNKPTNVISVLLGDGNPSHALRQSSHLGEIILCPDVLEAEAIEEGISFRERFSRMLVHGMIHLTGIDHERSSAEETSALELEESLVRALFPRRNP